jgi:hypothetical protein
MLYLLPANITSESHPWGSDSAVDSFHCVKAHASLLPFNGLLCTAAIAASKSLSIRCACYTYFLCMPQSPLEAVIHAKNDSGGRHASYTMRHTRRKCLWRPSYMRHTHRKCLWRPSYMPKMPLEAAIHASYTPKMPLEAAIHASYTPQKPLEAVIHAANGFGGRHTCVIHAKNASGGHHTCVIHAKNASGVS